jgi:hypothetical protein
VYVLPGLALKVLHFVHTVHVSVQHEFYYKQQLYDYFLTQHSSAGFSDENAVLDFSYYSY